MILIFLSFTLIDPESLFTSADEFSSKSISRKRFYFFVRILPYCPNLLAEPVARRAIFRQTQIKNKHRTWKIVYAFKIKKR